MSNYTHQQPRWTNNTKQQPNNPTFKIITTNLSLNLGKSALKVWNSSKEKIFNNHEKSKENNKESYMNKK